MADISPLDVPDEIDPLEHADQLIESYGRRIDAGNTIPMSEFMLLQEYIALRRFIKEETGY